MNDHQPGYPSILTTSDRQTLTTALGLLLDYITAAGGDTDDLAVVEKARVVVKDARSPRPRKFIDPDETLLQEVSR